MALKVPVLALLALVVSFIGFRALYAAEERPIEVIGSSF